jgi:hypothetical protein
MREYSDAIKLPKSYLPHPTTVVDKDYRLSNFWLAKEVNKELKKELLHQCLLTKCRKCIE